MGKPGFGDKTLREARRKAGARQDALHFMK